MQNKNFSEENKKRKEEKASIDKEEHVKEAYRQAEKDIEKDPDFVAGEDEDPDEGELAKKEGHP